MFSSSVTLDHFIQPVPICELTTDLETILTIFQSKPDEEIVVVNQQGLPIGIMRGTHLLKYLPQVLKFQLSENKVPLKDCLSECNNLLSQLRVLPAQMRVEQLADSLAKDPSWPPNLQAYGLVDEQNKFLGLLNSWKLLKFILSKSPTRVTQPSTTDSSTLDEIFFEFLEQLPFPAVLYSQKGQVLYQNCSWGQHLANYLPLEGIKPNFCPSFLLEPISLNQSSYSQNITNNFKKITDPDNLQANAYIAVELLSRQEFLPNPSQGQRTQPNYLSTEFKTLELPGLKANPSANPKLPIPSLSNQSWYEQSWQFIKIPLSFKKNGLSFEPSWLIVAVDRSEQQQFCQELALKNADLIQLNCLKDEFFTCISHELKSPLTSVIGLSSLLKEQKLGTLNERQIHYSELIYQSGRQLMMLVNDLLDLTRLETGKLKLKRIPIDIKTVCEKAYHSLEERYKGKLDSSIPFTLEIDPGIEQLTADELRLQQMLFHLLENAVKLSSTDGEIGLKVNRWENWIAFTVWDTGVGIPEESQNLLFQQWQSQESRLSEQLEGTGLGLVLTQRLAKAHGGEISFISRKDRGSQFTLLLPVTSKFPTITPVGLTENNLEKENNITTAVTQIYPLVLVVESIPTTIEQLTDLLTRLGYSVVIARTGTEALEKARQLQPETIFLNPLLPLLSGWDVLKLLKSEPATKQIRVIVTSFPCEQQHSEKVGADGFLSFPLEQSQLEKLLNKSNPVVSKQFEQLTILRLHPDLEELDWMGSVIEAEFDLCLGKQLSQLNCRLLEADSLDQAEMIASVWDINVVVLDGKSLKDPLNYLLCLSQCDNLVTLPLVTLDLEITESANKIGSFSVFPCLLPNHENKIEQLLEVIQIAAEARLGREQVRD